MSKRCPSCRYGPIGPFTDNCPICAEPVRNVRSERGGFFGGSGGMPSLVRWLIGGAVVLVLGVGGCCGLGMWQMGNAMKDAQQAMLQAQAEQEARRKQRTIVVDAATVLKEFQEDSVAADKKYLGMYLEVTGTLERSGRGRYESMFVILNAGNESSKIKFECFFDLAQHEEQVRIRKLDNGQKITLCGEYDGQVSNVQLRDCVLK